MRVYSAALLFLLLTACETSPAEPLATEDTAEASDPYLIASIDGDALNVIVEIPAGTNHKIEYHRGAGYLNDTLPDGSQRVINFLPYPGNYGFIPSTLVEKARGGDGDALDVLVIGEGVPVGTQLRVYPIATLLLRDRGEIDTKIIAVPADSTAQVFRADNFLDFSLGNDAAKRIIETWFLNYKGPNATELLRWEDEAYAWREVRRWRTDSEAIQ
ncbi:inorganic pyrophosphatase [Lewinella aquimaris]|uniref:inorganic diphosphatase n=1 Tax=Neolewinella aquimaris TaxID=1835722 RepID=A0A840E9U1_9BACT|nr:inorganic diphosphatase [Neolewinella aquimaris]MBB4078579.1 inorganic pyrophosphatase [Neolewinella aquimaris]